MAGGPGVGRRSVWTHFLGGVFKAVDEGCHDEIRHTGTRQQAWPIAAALDTCQLQTHRHHWTEELGVVIDACLEVRQQQRVPVGVLVIDTEHVLVTLDGQSCDEQGHTGKRKVVQELIGLQTGIGLRLEEIKVHTAVHAMRCRCHAVRCSRRSEGVRGQFHQLWLHLRSLQLQGLHMRVIFCVSAENGCHSNQNVCQKLNVHNIGCHQFQLQRYDKIVKCEE